MPNTNAVTIIKKSSSMSNVNDIRMKDNLQPIGSGSAPMPPTSQSKKSLADDREQDKRYKQEKIQEQNKIREQNEAREQDSTSLQYTATQESSSEDRDNYNRDNYRDYNDYSYHDQDNQNKNNKDNYDDPTGNGDNYYNNDN